ncbi:hypothetical protein NPIL_627801 [Nephila pilipes]|uniref:Uncharacterized protein n=1 Tax=Nephila pilipes TaxID=299642 RepID=A0A8X6MT15_NEPPI|nr:hypothetical protein NPIL_627801 [Nephila pilipes]
MPKKIKDEKNAVYGDSTTFPESSHLPPKDFGKLNLNVAIPTSGRPKTATTDDNFAKAKWKPKENRWREIPSLLGEVHGRKFRGTQAEEALEHEKDKRFSRSAEKDRSEFLDILLKEFTSKGEYHSVVNNHNSVNS